jgi:hypothetical protein
MNNTSAPQVALSAQAVINCYGGGSCNGGNDALVYEFAKLKGIPHASCEQYIAHNVDPIWDICCIHLCLTNG